MTENPKIEVGALNIAASPHPEGVYGNALHAVANRGVHIGGSDWAKITDPGPFEDKPDLLYGQVLVWTEIDVDGKWLNKRKNKEATPEEKKQAADAFPRDLGANFRAFNYIFVQSKHRLVLEYKNEVGSHFGPKRAEKLFRVLLGPKHLPEGSSEFAVTVVPEDDAIEKILSIPRLHWIQIFLERPNADDIGDKSEEVQKHLEKLGAKSQKIEYAKAAKIKSLKLDAKTREISEVAAINGYVSAVGKDAEGNRVDESTAKHPKTRIVPVQGASSFAAFLSALKLF